MPACLNLTGKRFGRLIVGERTISPPKCKLGASYICKCDCGNERTFRGRNLTTGHAKSCGCLNREVLSRTGSDRANWKGGRYIDSGGYAHIHTANISGQVYANVNQKKYVFEHVHVMTQHLGRSLRSGETVHHKNGMRNDNRFENLELWSKAQPAGQRVEDKLKWCREFLGQYGYRVE